MLILFAFPRRTVKVPMSDRWSQRRAFLTPRRLIHFRLIHFIKTMNDLRHTIPLNGNVIVWTPTRANMTRTERHTD